MTKRVKKIAVVADSVYPFATGGKEKRIYDITTRLASMGFEVTVYCMKLWEGPSTVVREGVTFCAISPAVGLYNGTRRSIVPAILFALCSFRMIGKKFDIADVDHIPHLVLFPMKLVCLLKGKPMFATWHEVWGGAYWREYLGGLGWLAAFIERWSIRLPDAIISVSGHTSLLLRPLAGPRKKIYTIPNGLDFSHISSLPAASKGADVVFAGRLLSHKNVDLLLRAVALLARSRPDVSAAIIGEGPEKERLLALSKKLGIERNVSFIGFFPTHDDLYRFMHASRVLSLPSSREGFGIVALEANACGLPVVTVALEHNATQDLIDEGKNGTVVEFSAGALAAGIEKFLSAPVPREACASYAKKYDWAPLARDIARIYEGEEPASAFKAPAPLPHIVVASSYFYPKIGGLENYAYLLAKELHSSGKFRVSILTSNYSSRGYLKETIDGMTVHRLPIMFVLSNTPLNPFWYWMVRKIFAQDPPSLVHVHSPVPYLPDIAAWAAKDVPVVLTYHSGSMQKGSFLVDLIIGAYESVFLKMLFARAEAVVTISQAFAKKTFPQFVDKMLFIPTGVDLSRFRKTPLPEAETVTYVGRIEHSSSWKGIEQLLVAMSEVVRERPYARLELVGGGDALEHYKKRAKELGIVGSAEFPGALTGQALVNAYARASVVVLASTSDSEAFSVALVEAMASGRPIIGTSIGGTPQVIEDGKNGLLVPPKDSHALARAILQVLSNREYAAGLADCGAKKVESFSWDIQAKKYADLFYSLIAKRKSP
jgi:glycosyltransferase involved in cell wall biosynthesis